MTDAVAYHVLEDEAILVKILREGATETVLRFDPEADPPGLKRRIESSPDSDPLIHVEVEYRSSPEAHKRRILDRWSFEVDSPCTFAWVPLLRPGKDLRVAAHAFRSPAAAVLRGGLLVALLPTTGDRDTWPWIRDAVLDLNLADGVGGKLAYGIEPTQPVEHVYFESDPQRDPAKRGLVRYSYDILVAEVGERVDGLRLLSRLLWSRRDRLEQHRVARLVVRSDRLAECAYGSLLEGGAFESLEINGQSCGGFRAEPGHAEYFRRPDPILWNQYWFNSQRTAYGLAFFGRLMDRESWRTAAGKITELSLAAPSWGGMFPAIYAYVDRDWWGSIPRLNGGRFRVHAADMVQTCEWLLKYHQDVAGDPRIIERCRGLADVLVRVQQRDGSIPPWYDWDGAHLQSAPELARSAESAYAAAYLLLTGARLGEADWIRSGRKASEFLVEHVLPEHEYTDFETFYSCSPKELGFRDPFTGLRPENTLAMYWVAGAMLRAYRESGDPAYLRSGREALDQLSLYQQTWSPPFLSVAAFGGFGVMNTDAEWSDARQSLFAPLYFDFYEETGDVEYLGRGKAALAASFVLACVPEHAELNPKGWELYAPGIMPENYAHSGRDQPSGRSDTCWGECGALSTSALVLNHYSKLTHES
jgi:hypothetical protein